MRLALVSLLFLFVIGCSTRGSDPVKYTQLAMDTVVEISLWQAGREIIDLAFKELKRIEDKFSFFNPDSEISRINNNLIQSISPETKYLIVEGRKYYQITNGAFDINYRQDKKYDLGGLVKGYAVDQLARLFKNKGIKRAMINIGGSLYLIGYPPEKNSWIVGIKDPQDPECLMGRLLLDKEVAVATSGNYERPGHIINPRTDKIADGVLSVTIVARAGIAADALSTGVFVLGKEKGSELIENLAEVEGVIVDKEGIWVSSGLKGKFKQL